MSRRFTRLPASAHASSAAARRNFAASSWARMLRSSSCLDARSRVRCPCMSWSSRRVSFNCLSRAATLPSAVCRAEDSRTKPSSRERTSARLSAASLDTRPPRRSMCASADASSPRRSMSWRSAPSWASRSCTACARRRSKFAARSSWTAMSIRCTLTSIFCNSSLYTWEVSSESRLSRWSTMPMPSKQPAKSSQVRSRNWTVRSASAAKARRPVRRPTAAMDCA
mmetsp:Transcript_122529/g.392089  ORF Transcript_122529/g.392089 Transcript_122529/m.392089 type:complete len:225 (-) Transcript_122529:289-963(-)